MNGAKPISLFPLTSEEALRRALSAPPPPKEAKPVAKANPRKKKAAKGKRD